jgi:hypothetical protein
MKLNPKICIWLDISGFQGWTSPDELEFRTPSVCQRICYLIEENDTHYKFVAGTSHTDYEDVCAIPKHNVIAIYDIKLPTQVKGLIKKFEKGHIVSESDLKEFEDNKKKTRGKNKINDKKVETEDKNKSKNESNKVVIEDSKDKGNATN